MWDLTITLYHSCSAPFSKQKFGSLFLQLYPQFRRVHESYCGNHPYAVALVTDNQYVSDVFFQRFIPWDSFFRERLGAFMESRGAPVPGLLTLTMSLSLPFRRLEKYPTSLLELHRQIGVNQSQDLLRAQFPQCAGLFILGQAFGLCRLPESVRDVWKIESKSPALISLLSERVFCRIELIW